MELLLFIAHLYKRRLRVSDMPEFHFYTTSHVCSCPSEAKIRKQFVISAPRPPRIVHVRCIEIEVVHNMSGRSLRDYI